MAFPPTPRVMSPAPEAPKPKPTKQDGDWIRWIKNRWWVFKTRCKRLRGDLIFVSERYYYYQPCKVCGSIMCKWATVDKNRRPV